LGALSMEELKESFWKVDVDHLLAAMCTTKYAAQCKNRLAATYSTTPSAPPTTTAAPAAATAGAPAATAAAPARTAAAPAAPAPALNDVEADAANFKARWDSEVIKMIRYDSPCNDSRSLAHVTVVNSRCMPKIVVDVSIHDPLLPNTLKLRRRQQNVSIF
jgi:hypothetical protein